MGLQLESPVQMPAAIAVRATPNAQ